MNEQAHDEAERESRRLALHAALLLAGLAFTLVATGSYGRSLATAAALLGLGALSFAGSGVCAIAARRHAFGAWVGGAAWGAGRMKSAPRSPRAAKLVGGALILVAIGLVALDVRWLLGSS